MATHAVTRGATHAEAHAGVRRDEQRWDAAAAAARRRTHARRGVLLAARFLKRGGAARKTERSGLARDSALPRRLLQLLVLAGRGRGCVRRGGAGEDCGALQPPDAT